MNVLTIYPSFICPFSCQYCAFRNRLSLDETLSLDALQQYLSNHNDIDEFVISGGDPLSLPSSYLKSLINVLKEYNKPVTLKAYPYSSEHIPDNVNYDFSYDFLGKGRASDAWTVLYNFKKPFKVTITLTPFMFKYHPNNLIKKLTCLPNIKELEFIPYCKNECNQWDIVKNDTFKRFMKMVFQCQMSLPYRMVNKDTIVKHITQSFEPTIEQCLFPDGQTYQKRFDNDILKYYPTNGDFNGLKALNYPNEINMYGDDMILWVKENAL